MRHNSVSIDRRKIILPPFDSSPRYELNGTKFAAIQSQDNISVLDGYLMLFNNNFVNIDRRNTIVPSFDSSHRDELNGIKIINFRSLDIKKFVISHFCLL